MSERCQNCGHAEFIHSGPSGECRDFNSATMTPCRCRTFVPEARPETGSDMAELTRYDDHQVRVVREWADENIQVALRDMCDDDLRLRGELAVSEARYERLKKKGSEAIKSMKTKTAQVFDDGLPAKSEPYVDSNWRVPSQYSKCRGGGPKEKCPNKPVADLQRGRAQRWWAYCEEHIADYNRELRNGQVWWKGTQDE